MAEISPLQAAMATLVAVFHKYSAKEGDKFKLNKAEVKELFKNELCMDHANDPKAADEIISSLDMDGDGEVDFEEYCILVAGMAMCLNEFFEGAEKKVPCKK